MSFFKKLRDRMFRSSDKIAEGLDALVGDDAAPAAGTSAPHGAPPHPAAPEPTPEPAPESAAGAAKPGLLGRLFGATDEPRRLVDDAMLESLEELLIQSDMGVETSVRVTANIAEGRFGKRISTRELKQALADEVARIMTPVAKPLPLYPKRPQVVLVVGVNGSGKTTTIGKLASQFKAAGKSV
ncbi:MAG: signal recognition particle-docking protein FtsY, partial [Pseudomonadota bacterium]